MSNHLHVVVEVIPQGAAEWSADDVAGRWSRLYTRRDQDASKRAEVLAGNASRIKELRRASARPAQAFAGSQLIPGWLVSSQKGFMRCLAEPIARRANREDGCKGHFWEAKFKCQTLLDETVVLSAMAYVDLNPVRARICDSLQDSVHTSARARLDSIAKDRHQIDRPLAPVLGLRGFGALAPKQRAYLELVDHTGRRIHPGKRGVITGPPPVALARIGYTADQWHRQVLAVGSGYFRAIGAAEVLIEKAQEIDQAWLRGIGVARELMRRAA